VLHQRHHTRRGRFFSPARESPIGGDPAAQLAVSIRTMCERLFYATFTIQRRPPSFSATPSRAIPTAPIPRRPTRSEIAHPGESNHNGANCSLGPDSMLWIRQATAGAAPVILPGTRSASTSPARQDAPPQCRLRDRLTTTHPATIPTRRTTTFSRRGLGVRAAASVGASASISVRCDLLRGRSLLPRANVKMDRLCASPHFWARLLPVQGRRRLLFVQRAVRKTRSGCYEHRTTRCSDSAAPSVLPEQGGDQVVPSRRLTAPRPRYFAVTWRSPRSRSGRSLEHHRAMGR